MRVTGVNANLPVADIAAARDFYTDYLGLSVEEFNLGWVARYRSPSGEASVQLVTRDATAPHDSVISVLVGASVDEAYAEAKRRLVSLFDETYTGEILRRTGGNMSEASRRAGLDRSNFRRLLKRHKEEE